MSQAGDLFQAAAPREAERARAVLSPLIIDHTHCGRHVTGLERITLELFSAEALAPLPVKTIRASGTAGMIAGQMLGLPARALLSRRSAVLCPGFPPSPLMLAFGSRLIPYIHDLFLITRPGDLNLRAKLYMAPPFRLAVRRLKRFFANSEYTRDELRKHCRADAEIQLYRPEVRNVFGLEPADRLARPAPRAGLRLVAVGTVEPRKNLLAAAAIVKALRGSGLPETRLDIVGRYGWGPDAEALKSKPGVTLHGYQPLEAAAALMERADMLISTAHDEGLGLPLIEAQYAGLPAAAPDKPVFREVLGDSGLFIEPSDPDAAAARIIEAVSSPGWRRSSHDLALANIARWNGLAANDKAEVIALLTRLLESRA